MRLPKWRRPIPFKGFSTEAVRALLDTMTVCYEEWKEVLR